MKSRTHKLDLLALLLIWLVAPIAAAEGASAIQGASPAYYISPGHESRLQITVHVWGEVHKPGLYVVPDNTDLVTLLSYAGGPTKNARVSSVKLVRTADHADQVDEIDVKDYIAHGNPNATLMLRPGDTVVVPGSVWYAVGRFFGFMTQVAIVASTANLIFFSE
ncbi:MAG: hypothetical protein CME06_02350 [Gemmatimonadetes bacterium]|nr:hypothetical protein [Gemmatimonadota bacterium]